MTAPAGRGLVSKAPRFWAALFFASCGLMLMTHAWYSENAEALEETRGEFERNKQLAVKLPDIQKELLQLQEARGQISEREFRALLRSDKPADKERRAVALQIWRHVEAAKAKLEASYQAILKLRDLHARQDALETADLLRGRLFTTASACAALTAGIWLLLFASGLSPLPAVPDGCRTPLARRWYWGWRGAWAVFWAALPLGLVALDPAWYVLSGPCECLPEPPLPGYHYRYYLGGAMLVAAAFIPGRTSRLFPPAGGEYRMGWPWRFIYRFFQRIWRRSATERELLELCGYLNASLSQGLPLNEAFRTFAAGIPAPWRQELFLGLAGRLEAGASLSAALEARPEFFPAAFSALIRAGEAQDDLPRALLLASEALSDDLAVGAGGAAVLGHSLLIGAVGLFVTSFTMTFVLPTYEAVYSSFGVPLPWATLVMVKVCHVLKLPLAAAGVAVVPASLYLWRSGGSPRRFVFSRLAPFRSLRRKIGEARLSRTLARLLSGGCAMDRAIELAMSVDADPGLRAGLERAAGEVKNGRPLSKALGASGSFSANLAWACALGEERGNLPETLLWYGDYSRLSVTAQLERLAPLIERTANVAMGALVGLFLVATMLPLFSLAGLVTP